MKFLKPILIVVLLLGLSITASNTFAGGPGFDTDVYTWGSSNDDDDGESNNNNNNNGYGCGDDDQYDDDDDDDVYDDNGNEIPLDGGLGFLAAAGAAFGIKRVRDRKSKNKED